MTFWNKLFIGRSKQQPVEVETSDEPELVYAVNAMWKMKNLAKDFERYWLDQSIIVAKDRGSNKVELFDVDMAVSKAWHEWQMKYRKGEDY